jgi:hypothetical protein
VNAEKVRTVFPLEVSKPIRISSITCQSLISGPSSKRFDTRIFPLGLAATPDPSFLLNGFNTAVPKRVGRRPTDRTPGCDPGNSGAIPDDGPSGETIVSP